MERISKVKDRTIESSQSDKTKMEKWIRKKKRHCRPITEDLTFIPSESWKVKTENEAEKQ